MKFTQENLKSNAPANPATDPDTEAQTRGPRQVIEQAARDVAHGLEDTDCHGTPSNVPGPAPATPEQAEVPEGGVSRKNYGERQLGHKAGGK